MKNLVFYLGLGLLFTHEMDAMRNHEWRVLPILRSLSEANGEIAFLLAHVPLFALTIGFVASLRLRTRLIARKLASAFLIVHAILHLAFSGHPNYEFSASLSNTLIYGAAFCGAFYFLALAIASSHDAVKGN
jgi:hypothetical protein